MSYEEVEKSWALSDKAREMQDQTEGELSQGDYWERLFKDHELVDVERTLKEGGSPLTQVFLKSPYGLRYRPEHKDWIPFRHGEVKIT